MDSAQFVADITIPDGTVLNPGQSFNKTWRIRNSGGCTWSGYSFIFTSGAQMNGPSSTTVSTTAPGQTVDITVPLVAPQGSGNYQGNWQLENTQGVIVSGGPYWVLISVPVTVGPPGGGGGDYTINVNAPTVVTPGQTFQPQVTVTIPSGQLLQSRGDMLRNSDGNLYGAWPFVAVVGAVNPGSPYTFTFYPDHPITAPGSEGNYTSVWQLWENGAWVGPQVAIAFTVKIGGGTRPNTPTPTSPANWDEQRDGTTPQLCASTSSGNVQYDFQLHDSAQTPDSGWINGNCWNPPTLGDYTFTWHVKVRDNASGLESGWSDDWHFTIDSQQLTMDPISFYPASPSAEDNSVQVRSCVQGFGNVNLGLSYEVNSANDGSSNGEWHGFSNHGENCPPLNDPSQWGSMPSRDYTDGDHLVRAIGTGPQGQTLTVYAVYHFNHRRPQDVQLLSPGDTVRVNTDAVTFTWRPSVNAQTYRLVISPNADFSAALFDQNVGSVTTYTYTFSQDYSPVYWEIFAINDVGQSSGSASFGIDRVAPTASITALPSTTPDSTFTVTWSGADGDAGLQWFNIQYRDGNAPGAAWVDWQTNTTATAVLFTGTPGHTYYFRAQAMDAATNIGPFASGNGDTHTTVDLNARPPTPWWNASYSGKRNAIILNNDANPLPAGYPIHLHFDASTTPTANDLYTASLAATKGDDIRIVYLDQTELPRFLANFTSSQVDIWFDLQAPIGPSPTTDSTSYQIYFGDASATNPPGTINDVIPEGTDANTLGLWHLQEGAGTSISDSSGNGHTGAASNMGWTSGKFGPAGVFLNANRAVVDLGQSTSFNTPVITLEAWVNPSTVGGEQSIFRKQADDGSLIYDFQVQGQVWLRLNGNEGNAHGNTTLQVGHWYHIAATYDGSTIRVYLNGVLDGSAPYNKPLRYGSSTHLYLGGDGQNNNKYFDGSIQDARISNVVRNTFPYAAFGTTQYEPSTNAGSVITPTAPAAPSLVVQEVDVYPGSGGTPTTIVATVQNAGTTATADGFANDLYLNHQPTGPGDYSGSITSWTVSSVDSNGTVTLVAQAASTDTAQITHIGRKQSNGKVAITESTQTFYVQADSSGVLANYDQLDQTITGAITVCTASPDPYPSDGSATSATPSSTDGVPQTHNFDVPGDQDWVSFAATAGVTYTISTANLGANADTVLALYDTDGSTLMASNDDVNGGPSSQIIWQAPTTGTYYVQVSDWSAAASGCGTNYDLSVLQGGILALSASSGSFQQSVAVTGTGFTGGEPVDLYWGSATGTPMTTMNADSGGAFHVSIAVPKAEMGSAMVMAIGMTSHQIAITSLQIQPSILLSATAGVAGATVNLEAYGFLGYDGVSEGETVNVYWASSSGTILGSASTDTTGSTGTIPLTIPAVSPGTYQVYTVGQGSGASVPATITVYDSQAVGMLTGRVQLWPTSPICQASKPCSTPMPQRQVNITTSDGTLVASVTTDQQGAYSISLPPASYTLHVVLSPSLPGTRQRTPGLVSVTLGQTAQSNISVDSGLR